MRSTMLSGHTCPTCDSYTMAQSTGKSDYCTTCLTVVTRFRNVKVVQPGAFRQDSAIR